MRRIAAIAAVGLAGIAGVQRFGQDLQNSTAEIEEIDDRNQVSMLVGEINDAATPIDAAAMAKAMTAARELGAVEPTVAVLALKLADRLEAGYGADPALQLLVPAGADGLPPTPALDAVARLMILSGNTTVTGLTSGHARFPATGSEAGLVRTAVAVLNGARPTNPLSVAAIERGQVGPSVGLGRN